MPMLAILRSVRAWATIGGYLLALFFVWAYLGVRDDLAAQRETCNTAVQASAREAEKVTREAERRGYEARLAQKDAQVASERKAREIADLARQEAESRPPVTRETIRREVDLNACLAAPVPAAIRSTI